MSDKDKPPSVRRRLANLFRGAVLKGVDITFADKFHSLADELFEFDTDFDEEVIPLIGNMLERSKKNAHDIMVPLSRVKSLNASMSREEVFRTIRETRHSRYPILGASPDSIVGILHVRDLLASVLNEDSKEDFNLEALRRDINVVPQDQGIVALLSHFRRESAHLAIVEDEYSQFVGLVTMEDVFEQFFGEIQDEHDEGEEAEVLIDHDNGGALHSGNGHSDVSADLSIDEFNEKFEASLSNDQNNTIGGYLATKLGHVPVVGEKTKEGELRFEVLEANERRITKVRVKRKEQ